jgi:cytochrome b pre-mRNA-processing protein 3
VFVFKRLWQNLHIRFKPNWQRPEVVRLYQSLSAMARAETFYRQAGVPDTVDGRFELLALHLCLCLRRLKDQGPQAEKLRQDLFDLFAADMDRSLREMGVGDMGISRRMKRMGEGFYGRYAVYDAALSLPEAEREVALMTALDKNLYGTVPSDEAKLRIMLEKLLTRAADFVAQPLERFLMGDIEDCG